MHGKFHKANYADALGEKQVPVWIFLKSILAYVDELQESLTWES